MPASECSALNRLARSVLKLRLDSICLKPLGARLGRGSPSKLSYESLWIILNHFELFSESAPFRALGPRAIRFGSP